MVLKKSTLWHTCPVLCCLTVNQAGGLIQVQKISLPLGCFFMTTSLVWPSVCLHKCSPTQRGEVGAVFCIWVYMQQHRLRCVSGCGCVFIPVLLITCSKYLPSVQHSRACGTECSWSLPREALPLWLQKPPRMGTAPGDGWMRCMQQSLGFIVQAARALIMWGFSFLSRARACESTGHLFFSGEKKKKRCVRRGTAAH